MLSYRHLYHAGNHADVLKHLVLCEVLRHFNLKDKPYWYVDTHAGAGQYDLGSRQAMQNAEYRDGIARLWDRPDLPAPLAEFVGVLRGIGEDGLLRHYPGSPVLAGAMQRTGDRMYLFERHPADAELLQRRFRGRGRQVRVIAEDGFAGLLALLPPRPRRAVVLIDPSYEDKSDYPRVVETLRAAYRRFAQGSYLLWYPLLPRTEPRVLSDRLGRLGAKAWLRVELRVRSPAGEAGMYGSGVFVINPPWNLPARLEGLMPTLVQCLGTDGGAGFVLNHAIP